MADVCGPIHLPRIGRCVLNTTQIVYPFPTEQLHKVILTSIMAQTYCFSLSFPFSTILASLSGLVLFYPSVAEPGPMVKEPCYHADHLPPKTSAAVAVYMHVHLMQEYM